MDQQIKKILIVEDDGLLLNVMADKFKNYNFKVLRAENGKKAVDSIFLEKPDLMILDLLIPVLDGFKVLETIRNYPDKVISGMKVIVLSNLWTAKDILSARALKIEEYFVKSSTDLNQVCEKALICLKEEQQESK